MSRVVLLIGFLSVCLSSSVFAQSSAVSVEKVEANGAIELFCINNKNQPLEVTLKLDQHKNLKGYSKPVTKTIAPGARISFLKLKATGRYTYRYSTSYTMKRSAGSGVASRGGVKPVAPKQDFGDIKKGIVVFDKSNCSRCSMATSYLTDAGIDFKIIDVSRANSEGNILMWQLLQEEKVNAKKGIMTPVILVDGELSHTHKNLRKFLEKLIASR